MVERNQRKLEILDFIVENPEATARQLSQELDIERSNAKRRLGEYWKQGLLHRRIIDPKTRARAYSITPKGLDRIVYLKNLGW